MIQELIALAKSLREQPDDGLTPEEAAFYDALAKNESAVEVMGNAQLQVIAAELVKTIREKSTVDWWRRDNVRAAMRRDVRRLLRKYGFPPDLQDDAVTARDPAGRGACPAGVAGGVTMREARDGSAA